jgi:hypothetical protein
MYWKLQKSPTSFQMFATFPIHNDTKNNLKGVCMMQWNPKLSQCCNFNYKLKLNDFGTYFQKGLMVKMCS